MDFRTSFYLNCLSVKFTDLKKPMPHHVLSRMWFLHTGPFMSLHWLPVKSRVQFKIGLVPYKVYKNKYPACLENYIGAYIILDTVNVLVICLTFHIITINSTNPLRICPIVFSIQLHDYGTHFLRLVDVRLL